MPFCLPANIIVPPGRFRPVDYKSSDFKELVESIKSIGQLQPVLASKTPVFCSSLEEGQLELIDGLHRLEACRVLVRKVWFDTDKEGQLSLDDPDMRKIAELHTGIRRIDFTTQQRSAGIAELHTIMQKKYGTPGTGGRGRTDGWTLDDTAAKLGFKDKKTVQDAITIHRAIESGIVPGIEQAKNQAEALKMVRDVVKRAALEEASRRRALQIETELGDPYKHFGNRLILGSCQLLKEQPPNICSLWITDPPWGVDIDRKEQRDGSVSQKSLPEYDDSMDVLPLLEETITQMARVGKPDCWVVMFCGARYWNWLREQFNKQGFQVYSKPLIWVRTQKDGSLFAGKSAVPTQWPASITDFILLARRGDARLFKLNAPDVFLCQGIPGSDKIHRAQKPLPLMQEIIERLYHPGTNPLLIDPFAGSGATLVAARKVGIKNYFGYELDPANREQAISYMVREYLAEQEPPKVSEELDLSDMPED